MLKGVGAKAGVGKGCIGSAISDKVVSEGTLRK